MADVEPFEAQAGADWIGKQLAKQAKQVSAKEIAEAVSDVEIQTQTKGSSFIKLHMIDPEWQLTCSGLIDRDAEGLLPALELEFPQHTSQFWVLCAAEPSNELSQPNLVLTFEDRIVRKLKERWGPKRAAPGFNTRAEFVRSLCVEAGVKYRIPSVEGSQEKRNKELTALGIVRRTREREQFNAKFNKEFNARFNKEFNEQYEAGLAFTPEGTAGVQAGGIKEKGVTAGSNITIKGAKPSATQIKLINEVLGIANQLKAGQLATEALIEACIAENDFTNNPGGGGGSTGLLQLIPSTARALGVNPLNVSQTVDAFLTKSQGRAKEGAIGYAKEHPNAFGYEVAQAVQASGAGESTNGAANYGAVATEAKAIIAAYGGVKAPGSSSQASTKEGEVARGTTGNPSENSWDCLVRLAGAVNWSVFTNGQYLFYMDGPELANQRPSLYVYPKPDENRVVREDLRGKRVTEEGVIQVPLNATFDNTTMEYFQTHRVKGKVLKRSRIGRPQSPSEIKLNLVCETSTFAAGEVLELIKAGPLNGRWIIVDATRNVFKDRFTQLLLEPPQAPLAESEEGKVAEHAEPLSGSLAGAAEQARKALAERSKYFYTESSPARENNGTLFGPAPRSMDCSAFATLCYKAAGLPDPSKRNYRPIGWTGSMIEHMEKTSKPEPGCLCFYGPSTSSTQHVTVYVGNGKVISMGGPGDPHEGPAESTGPAGFLGYWVPK